MSLDPAPPLHLELNAGSTNFDQRHNLVVSGTALIPKTGGLNFSWVARALSGTPFSRPLTGGTRAAYSEGGLYGPIDDVMHPLHHGLLAFVGFSIVEPFVVYGPGRMDVSQRAQVLSDYRARLTAIDTAPLLPQLRSADYEDFVRRTVQQG